MRGAGRATFAAFLLLIAGFFNVIYGIGALDNANYFANDTRFIKRSWAAQRQRSRPDWLSSGTRP